jgi:hypothetical protein
LWPVGYELAALYLYRDWLPGSGEETRDFPLYCQRVSVFPDVPEHEAITDMARAAVNDLAKENVTPGEMEAVHDDLTRLRREVDELTVRLEAVEERNKDH